MLPLERQNRILEILAVRKAASVEELCRELYSSGATIRRDLAYLESSGLLCRTHGGAVRMEESGRDFPLLLRESENTVSKAVSYTHLKIGFYYSLIDWHHPDFPVDMLHPRRDDENAEQLNEGRDMHRYAQYMRNQVTELLTNYGKIDILWFDFSYSGHVPPEGKEWMKGKGKDDWESEALLKTARDLQPGIIIDNRTEIEQDLWTPEQYQMTEWLRDKETGELLTWEACQTFSGSWGIIAMK